MTDPRTLSPCVLRHCALGHRGFTLLETMLALAFLAVASGLTLKMHQSRLDYDRSAIDRLAHRLKVENIAERISAIQDEQLAESAKQIATASGVDIQVQPFETELPGSNADEESTAKGWHVIITSQSASGPVQNHSWRLKGQP